MKKSTRKVSLSCFVLTTSCLPLTLFSGNVMAADFNYTSIEAGYSQTSLEVPGLEKTDLMGYTLTGAYELNPTIVVGASFSSGKADSRAEFQQIGVQSVELESSGPSVFGFYHNELNDSTDYLIGGSFSKFETEGTRNGGTDIPELSGNNESKSVFAGLRHKLNDRIELGLVADYDLDAEGG